MKKNQQRGDTLKIYLNIKKRLYAFIHKAF